MIKIPDNLKKDEKTKKSISYKQELDKNKIKFEKLVECLKETVDVL
jgi:hypothetical protein